MARGELDAWLVEGEVSAEADWVGYLLRLAVRGELGQAGRRVLLDLPALAQPFACQSGACTPGRRAPGIRSCCADLEVSLTEAERAAIDADLPHIAEVMARWDGRWAAGAPEWWDAEEGALSRPGRRCVFAIEAAEGLRCGLQVAGRGLKPMPCRLFPLAVVDLGDGRVLLTAVSRRTASMLGAPSPRRFPCLGAPDLPSLAEAEAATLRQVFGPRIAQRIQEAVAEWQASLSEAPASS